MCKRVTYFGLLLIDMKAFVLGYCFPSERRCICNGQNKLYLYITFRGLFVFNILGEFSVRENCLSLAFRNVLGVRLS